MANSKRRQHDVLVVSSYEKFSASVERALSDGRYREIEVRKSASTTRRDLLERRYDIAIINIPLSDEPGVELALDIATRYTTGVIITASAEISEDVAERVTDYGIMVISKPATSKAVSRSVRLLCAILDRLKSTEKKVLTLEEKMEEIRIVNRAKWKLINDKQMKEDEAHQYIGKLAMDRCITRREVAEEIIKE